MWLNSPVVVHDEGVNMEDPCYSQTRRYQTAVRSRRYRHTSSTDTRALQDTALTARSGPETTACHGASRIRDLHTGSGSSYSLSMRASAALRAASTAASPPMAKRAPSNSSIL